MLAPYNRLILYGDDRQSNKSAMFDLGIKTGKAEWVLICLAYFLTQKLAVENTAARRARKLELHLPATAITVFAFSPLTRKTMLRCEESTLSFSRKKGLSTPYSCRVENLTSKLSGPARAFSSTRFFLPLIYPHVLDGAALCDVDITLHPRAEEAALAAPSRLYPQH